MMPLRVLHLTTVASPIAGAELTSILLARELPAEGIELEVCTLSPDGQMQERLAALGRNASSLDARGPAGSVRGLVRLQRCIRRLRPHVIHSQLFHAGILGAVVAKPARLPFVLTRQYVWGVEWYRGRLARRVDAWVARQARMVIAISSEAKAFLETNYGLSSERIRIVHNAADVDRFANLPREDVAGTAPDGELRMVYVASLHPRKGHRHLMEAMRILKQRGKRVRVLLVGDGEERAMLEQLVRETGIDDCVSFLGWRQDVDAVLATAQLYVHPALEEAFGIAIAEAMAAGLPVVASRTGGIPDVVADGVTGFLVPAADGEALAERLCRLIDDPRLRATMGAAGRARALALFSPHKLARSYAEVFRRVVEPPAAAIAS